MRLEPLNPPCYNRPVNQLRNHLNNIELLNHELTSFYNDINDETIIISDLDPMFVVCSEIMNDMIENHPRDYDEHWSGMMTIIYGMGGKDFESEFVMVDYKSWKAFYYSKCLKVASRT
jgi:hypothetical protein